MSGNLAELVADLGAELAGSGATRIQGLTCDSRLVRAGDLFVALRGESTDGHEHIAAAVDAGAVALLVDRDVAIRPPGVAIARVPDTRETVADVARRFYGDPGRKLTLIGVTGTNGKTSTVRLIEAVLRAAHIAVGSMGTISVRYPDGEEPAHLTTPDALEVQRRLARMRDAGATHVALEVSSHSLVQQRVRGLRFAVGVFTNLTQDHLDYHRDMGAYAQAKAQLFGSEYLAGTGVLNQGDPLCERLRSEIAEGRNVLCYGRGEASSADVKTVAESIGLERTALKIAYRGEQRDLSLPLPGDFQVENALAAVCTALALGVDWAAIRRGIENCEPIPGRLERVSTDRPIVLVDYAHTPAALEQVVSRVRPLVSGRLISVFGCGGDRDRTKRAPMARAACAHSDLAIATSDNPRTEDPEAILRDVAEGLSGCHEIIVDRRDAIRRAITQATPDDVVIIAGKGHEDYQILGREKVPFDDRVEARRALDARGARA